MPEEIAAPAGSEVMSDRGAYHVWFDGPIALAVGAEGLYTVTVRDGGGAPVLGLDLAPTFIHTVMGHGGPKAPSAAEEGYGIYRVESVIASMSGAWELDVTLPGDDAARLVVDVQ